MRNDIVAKSQQSSQDRILENQAMMCRFENEIRESDRHTDHARNAMSTQSSIQAPKEPVNLCAA